MGIGAAFVRGLANPALHEPCPVGLVFVQDVIREPLPKKRQQLDADRSLAALEPLQECGNLSS